MNHPTQERRRIFGICRRTALSALAVAIVLLLAVVATGSAQAQSYTFRVVLSFSGSDGANPHGGVVLDAQGNLYGTTSGGGAYGFGTVFKLDTTGQETVLYSFAGGADGENPLGVVLDAQGNLYGTTEEGGASNLGTVFKVDTSGNKTVLYSFTGTPDGGNPYAGVVLDSQGNLYGTTFGGGADGYGTVFKVDTSGNETVLYSFGTTGGDGLFPVKGVVLDAEGNLYGTTSAGGAHEKGTVFKLGTTGQETVLYSFAGKPDGEYPNGVVLDAQGNLYGTTDQGGVYDVGTAFEVYATGGEQLLYNFAVMDGFLPVGSVALDAQGNLYGACGAGPGVNGLGTVFQLASYNLANIHIFRGYRKEGDGAEPYAGVVLDAQGNLYGTTSYGGAYDTGTVFALLTPAEATTTTLTSAPNPSIPGQAVIFTAVVSGEAGAPPNGEAVTFMNVKTKTALGTGALSGGSASLTTSTLNIGATDVIAVYGGDVHLIGSKSNKLKQVVEKAKTTAALSSSPNPSANGQTVIFTAVVSSDAGAPPDGETVSFMKGTTVLGTGALSGGSATFTTSDLPEGTNSIKAKYSGDSSFDGSTSNIVKQVVEK